MTKTKKNILSKPALRRKKPTRILKKTSEVNAFNKELLIKLYREMLLIRRFEEKAGQLYGMGLIQGFCHLYIGQEAVVTGMQMAAKEGDQVVIATGKEAWRKARPTSAGLKTLKPIPPKSTLPSATATTAPTAAIQSGKPGGRVSASRSPVIIILPSEMVEGFPETKQKNRSVRMLTTVHVNRRAKALSPNCHTLNRHTGARA